MPQAETVALATLLAMRPPVGTIVHARAVLRAVSAQALTLVDEADGDVSMEIAATSEKAVAARPRIDWDVVASILLRADGGKRLVALHSPSEFALWRSTRGRA